MANTPLQEKENGRSARMYAASSETQVFLRDVFKAEWETMLGNSENCGLAVRLLKSGILTQRDFDEIMVPRKQNDRNIILFMKLPARVTSDNFQDFLKVLENAGQNDICGKLLAQWKNFDRGKPELPSDLLNAKPSDDDVWEIAEKLHAKNNEWNDLGRALGLSHDAIQNIMALHKTPIWTTYLLLSEWRNSSSEDQSPTFTELSQALQQQGVKLKLDFFGGIILIYQGNHDDEEDIQNQVKWNATVNRDKTLRAMEEENGGLQPSKNTVDGSKVFDSKNVKLKNVEGGLNKSEGESIKKHINVEEIYKQQTQTLAEKEKTRRLAERYGRHEDRSKELEEKLMMKHSLLVEAQQRNLELEAALVDTKAQIEKMKLQLGGRKDAHSLARTSGCPKDSYDETSIAESCGLQPSISTSANGRSSQITQVWLQSGKTEVENRQCLGDTAASAVSVNDVADKEEDLPLVSQKLRPETRKDGIRLAERIKASAILVRKGTKGNLAVYGLRGTANLVERRVEMAKYNVGILFGT